MVDLTEKRFEVFSTSIAQIWRSIQRLKTRAMLPFGLRSTHLMCLFFLWQSGRGLTAAEISELSELDKAAVSRAVAELVKLGYAIYPEPDESRKYRARLVLTEKGREVSDRLDNAIEDVVESAGKGLTDKEREIFYKGLTLISSNLKALSEDCDISL